MCSSGELDEQSYVTRCPALKQNKFSQFNYNSLFSENLHILKNAIRKYEAAWNEICVLRSLKEKENKSEVKVLPYRYPQI